VIDCPELIVGALGDITPADNAPLTVTVLPGEQEEAMGLPWDESVAL